jgi:hypothetical protein
MILVACPTQNYLENGCFEYRHLCYDYCYSKILIEYHHVLADIMEPTLVVVCQRAVH